MNGIQVDYIKMIQDLINEDASPIRYKNIPASARMEYIEKYDDAPLELVFSLDKPEFKGISDDEKKSKYLLQAYSKIHSAKILGYADVISDDFYKMKVREQLGNKEYDNIVDNFMQESKAYKETLEKIQDMSEEEKYNYISTLDNKDIKVLFFYKTTDASRRKVIVDSFKEDIDDWLMEPAKLAQKMIIDFFANNSNGQLTEKNKQELEMIFKRTKIELDDNLDYFINAQMRHTDYVMKINPNLLVAEPQKLILYFLHEYGHAISMKKFKVADYLISDILSDEEGMSDTFADLVAKSYNEKQGNIKLNGKNVDLKKASILKYSGYKGYNNLVRTMLYLAEQKENDKEAVFSYYFDDKLRFYELTLGSEYVKKLPEGFNKNPCAFRFEDEDIYSYVKEDFRALNEESIYLINNEPLKAFIKDNRKRKSIQIANKESSGKIQSASTSKMDMIDYYKKYGIDRDEKWETIRRKLTKEQVKWVKRAAATSNPTVLDEIFQQIDEISAVWVLLKPGNKEKRNKYDARLEQQRKEKDKVGNGNISLKDVGASIRNKPPSLNGLIKTKKTMTRQINEITENRGHVQPNPAKQPQIYDNEI